MIYQVATIIVVGTMTVACSFQSSHQPCNCACTSPCSHHSQMYPQQGSGPYGGGYQYGMYGQGGVVPSSASLYGGWYGASENGYGGFANPSHTSYGGYQGAGYRIKPKTKLGWDHYSGGLRLKTKYKVKPMNGYPPVYAPTGYTQPPAYVQNHPLGQYAAAGPAFGGPIQSFGRQPPMSQPLPYGGYGQAPYYSGPTAYNNYGSRYNQHNCQW